jgi:hypothetical protein
MYLRPLCSAPNVHRPFPLPCVCTVVPCLEIASLHSRLSLFVSARHQGLGRHGHNALSALIVATFRGLIIRLNLPLSSDGTILPVFLLVFQLLDRPLVPLLVLHDLALHNPLLLLIESSYSLDFGLH